MSGSSVLFWLITLWVIGIFIVLVSINIDTSPNIPPSDEPVSIPGLGPCVPIELLVDVTDEKCCVVAGQLTTTRYSNEFNAVVGPTATLWTQACNTLNQTEQIQQCLTDLEPNACNSKAAAVARVGITKYYVRNFGNGGCSQTADCR